jgi:hypothetical protein
MKITLDLPAVLTGGAVALVLGLVAGFTPQVTQVTSQTPATADPIQEGSPPPALKSAEDLQWDGRLGLDGTWILDESATTAVWAKPSPSEPRQLEVQVEKGQRALVLPDSSRFLPVAIWFEGGFGGVEFSVPGAGNEGKDSLLRLLRVGDGIDARLIVTTQDGGRNASSYCIYRQQQDRPRSRVQSGYWTKVEEVSDSIVKLTNGAILEPIGYVGYVGYGKRAFLKSQTGVLWIEGKGDCHVSTLKGPMSSRRRSFTTKTISKSTADGSLFVFTDRTIFDPLFPTFVGAFTDFQNCTVVEGTDLLFEDGQIIEGGIIR